MLQNHIYCIVNGEVNIMRVRSVTLNICWFSRLKVSTVKFLCVNAIVFLSISKTFLYFRCLKLTL
jgi:hypothetical protein